jgi:hypothetical protein
MIADHPLFFLPPRPSHLSWSRGRVFILLQPSKVAHQRGFTKKIHAYPNHLSAITG